MIQLDIFSPLYKSTLGFDVDLIDYTTFIKDNQIRNLFPRPIVDPRGRKPWNAVILTATCFYPVWNE